jgi:pyruvate formate lyase activating enzyme
MEESYLYEKLKEKCVRCQTCSHGCQIAPNQRGICGVRENRNGTLAVLNYGRAVAAHIDPIEKKPLFHFLPGSRTYSFAAVGCNLRCANCQNFDISQITKQPQLSAVAIAAMGDKLSPPEIVKNAIENSCPSISYTYSEPTIFLEYALDTMKLAKNAGLKNVWVSNGFMSRKTLELIAPYLDAINIDLKSFDDNFYRRYCGARLEPILETLQLAKKLSVWVEVTTLIIPGLSDDEKMLRQIAQFMNHDLGSETPWHISRFSGAISWQLTDRPETPVATLGKTRRIGLTAGLKYVYSGNVPGMASENTYCPRCQKLNIERVGYHIMRFDRNGQCANCGENLNLILN